MEIPWHELRGGYGITFDPRPLIASLAAGGGDWGELWENLYHQGDVGLASYAAVPLIADLVANGHSREWNAYALVATVEEARGEVRNPPLPDWLAPSYDAALGTLFRTGFVELTSATDEILVASIIAILANCKRLPALARFAMLGETERRDALNELEWA